MRKTVAVLGIACLAVFSLTTCSLFEKPLDVRVDFTSTQYNQTASPWVFQLLFTTAPSAGVLYPSSGPTLGGTIVSVNVRTNRLVSITGVRIEDVRYRPTNASTHINYVHPTLGEITPIFANLATSFDYSGGYGALQMNPDTDNVFEVNLSSELSLWDHIDFDGDGTSFRTDNNEVLAVRCNMFLEGFLPDGTEFRGSFPVPLSLDITLSHQ